MTGRRVWAVGLAVCGLVSGVLGLAAPLAAQSVGYGTEADYVRLMRTAVEIHSGPGSPESAQAAPVGSLFLSDAGTVWRKATGTGTTGWVVLVSAGDTATLASVTLTSGIGMVQGAEPYWQWYDTDGGTDLKYARAVYDGGVWKLQKVNDVYGTATNLLTVDSGGNATVPGALSVNGTAWGPLFASNSAVSGASTVGWYSGNVARWLVTKSGTESGGNTGGNLQITRHSDTGANLGAVVYMDRAAGLVRVGTSTVGTQAHQLQVSGSVDSGASFPALKLENRSATGTSVATELAFATYGDVAKITAYGNPSTTYQGRLQLQTRVGASTWNTGIYIDGTGLVGVNTTSPTAGAALTVSGTSSVQSMIPVASATYDLGNTSYRWRELWATDAAFGTAIDTNSRVAISTGAKLYGTYSINGTVTDGATGVYGRGYTTSGTGATYGVRAYSDGPRGTGTNVGLIAYATGAPTNWAIQVASGQVSLGTDTTHSGTHLPFAADTYNLGSSSLIWNEAFVGQINAVIFAETTATLFGGYSIIGKNAGSFAADVASGATTINFGKAMTPGHWVVVRAHDTSGVIKVEYLLIGSLVSGTTYNVTRDLAAAHSTDPAWAAGTAYLVTGASGDGRIELNAYTTPRISILNQGAAYNATTELVRLGYLDGFGSIPSGKVGLAIGASGNTLTYYDGVLTIAGNGSGLTAITGGNITTDTITATQIAANAITTSELNADAVTSAKIAANTITAADIAAGTITATEIAASTITANKLVIQPGAGTINEDPFLTDSTAWTWTQYAGTFPAISDAPVGTTVARSSGSGQSFLFSTRYYPVDTSKKYRVRFWVRGVGANGLLFSTLQQFTSIGVTCATNSGFSPYKVAGVAMSGLSAWTEYSYEFGTTSGDWQTGVKLVKLATFLNYNGTAGYAELAYWRFEEVIPGELIVDGAITAAKIAAATITGDKISAATSITAGTGNNIGVLSGSDGTYRIWAGHATAASAPFRVTQAGVLTATGATISGTVTATTGAVGGWTLGATSLLAGSGSTTVGLDAGGTNPAIYAGSATPASAPFRVTQAGALTSTSGTIGGWTIGTTSLTGGSGGTTVGLDVGGTNPALYAGSATPASAPFRVSNTGVLTATGATISGTLTATSGTIGGWTLGSTSLTAGSAGTTVGLDSGGTNPAFYAGSATPSSAPFRVSNTGGLTATNATITGTIYASSGYFGDSSNDITIDSQGIAVNDNGRISVAGGKVLLNTNGLSIESGTGTGNQLKWTGGGTVGIHSNGYMLNFDATQYNFNIGSSYGVVFGSDGEIRRMGASGSIGLSTNHWLGGHFDDLYVYDELRLDAPPSTTYDDYPLVWSSGNKLAYYKTDGLNGSYCTAGGEVVDDIVIERGIVVSVGCVANPPAAFLQEQIDALRQEIALLSRQRQ